MLLTSDTLRNALGRQEPRVRGRAQVDSTTLSAAVALPVHLGEDPRVIAVLRAGTMREHAGEVAFPGGKTEPTDVDLRATALRELAEEVDLGEDDVEVVGTLGAVPVITGRFLIHPFVAEVRAGRQARVASSEIARVLPLPIADWLVRGREILAVQSQWRGHTFVTPHFELDGCVLYGASAYVFYELLGKIAAELGLELPAPKLVAEQPWGSRYG
jgi:8-oxo-dGTP pyrophosphatase MutT (NUDIX family)